MAATRPGGRRAKARPADATRPRTRKRPPDNRRKQEETGGRFQPGQSGNPGTQFTPGQSGNPGGRPRRAATERAKALALREAYRTVTVKEDGKALALPAIQAILRSQIVLAAKGNVQAQRAVLAAIQTIEQENVEVAARAAQNAPKEMNYTEAARRVAFLLHLGEEEQKVKSEEEKRAANAAPSGTGEAPGAAPRAPRVDAGPR
jgi:hypothetical protein